MRFVITGATGMIARQLTEALAREGQTLTLLARKPFPTDRSHKISLWNPDLGEINASDLERQDVVIHLAGKNIAAGHWSQGRKRTILESRVQSTELLCQTLAGLRHPPHTLLSASAVGYYGNHPAEEVIDETGAPGEGFMASVCVQWEDATKTAEAAGIRVVHLRTGIVISPSGGVLARMLPIFRLGVGGKIGSGKQVVSWIALEELPSALSHIITHPTLSGAVNLVSPNPVTNADFARLLAKALTRPAFFPVPSFGAKLAFGEMAEELLLAGAWVVPRKLIDSGYHYSFPDLAGVFAKMLGPERQT